MTNRQGFCRDEALPRPLVFRFIFFWKLVTGNFPPPILSGKSATADPCAVVTDHQKRNARLFRDSFSSLFSPKHFETFFLLTLHFGYGNYGGSTANFPPLPMPP
jgi:hypothetical protein